MNKEFWNDVASKGAVLGMIMLASHLFEETALLSGSVALMGAAAVEMVVVAAAYIWAMLRFTKQAAHRYGSKTAGFTYVQGLLYVLWISMFAGIVVGLGRYMYIHYALGYENYVASVVENVNRMIGEMDVMPSIVQKYKETLSAIADTPEPNVLNSISSSIFSYCMWGTAAGLFVAAAAKRGPETFRDDEI